LFSDTFDKYYIGQTNNLKARIRKHNNGEVISTKPYIPYHIVWSCEKPTRKESDAVREKVIEFKI